MQKRQGSFDKMTALEMIDFDIKSITWKNEGKAGPLYVNGESEYINFMNGSLSSFGNYYAAWFTLEYGEQLAKKLNVPINIV